MTEKRFTTDTPNSLSEIYDDGRILTNGEVIKYINWYREDMRKFSVENEQLKEVLGSILIEVRRDISATNHSGEVKAFVTPNSFDLISNVLKKYGALKDWYE